MSLYGALFAGVSGLSAQSNAMGMISDNIANVNTVGYKRLEARFSSLVTQETTLTQHSPGGVTASPYSRIEQQGLLQGSSSNTDLAIAGEGFFVVHEQANPSLGSNFLFTRAGSFNPDQNGDLRNAAGYLGLGSPSGCRFLRCHACNAPPRLWPVRMQPLHTGTRPP